MNQRNRPFHLTPTVERIVIALTAVAALLIVYAGLSNPPTGPEEAGTGRIESGRETAPPAPSSEADRSDAAEVAQPGKPTVPRRSAGSSKPGEAAGTQRRTVRLADGRSLQVEGIRRGSDGVTLQLAENVQLVVSPASIVNWPDLEQVVGTGPSPSSTIVVQFDDGRTLEVAAVERSGDVATIHLEGGGSLAVMASQISNWDDIEEQSRR